MTSNFVISSSGRKITTLKMFSLHLHSTSSSNRHLLKHPLKSFFYTNDVWIHWIDILFQNPDTMMITSHLLFSLKWKIKTNYMPLQSLCFVEEKSQVVFILVHDFYLSLWQDWGDLAGFKKCDSSLLRKQLDATRKEQNMCYVIWRRCGSGPFFLMTWHEEEEEDERGWIKPTFPDAARKLLFHQMPSPSNHHQVYHDCHHERWWDDSRRRRVCYVKLVFLPGECLWILRSLQWLGEVRSSSTGSSGSG